MRPWLFPLVKARTSAFDRLNWIDNRAKGLTGFPEAFHRGA